MAYTPHYAIILSEVLESYGFNVKGAVGSMEKAILEIADKRKYGMSIQSAMDELKQNYAKGKFGWPSYSGEYKSAAETAYDPSVQKGFFKRGSHEAPIGYGPSPSLRERLFNRLYPGMLSMSTKPKTPTVDERLDKLIQSRSPLESSKRKGVLNKLYKKRPEQWSGEDAAWHGTTSVPMERHDTII